MLRYIFAILSLLSFCACHAHPSQSTSSPFHFNEEARAALCPFVGFEGMRCFDNNHMESSQKQMEAPIMKLPRGVGMSVDQMTGEIKALAVELTYHEEGSHIWTDGFTGNMYDMIKEARLRPAIGVVPDDDASRVLIFQNASQIHGAWQQRFIDGKIRGGQLARRPDMLEYSNGFFKNGEALALSQRMIGLYTLTLNASNIRLNSFARDALAQLTATCNPNLYEAFIDVWGTHVITKSLIGGMVEERAKVVRCYRAADEKMFARCIPFHDRRLTTSGSCGYYAAQTHVISKRYLGGNVDVDEEHEWKKTLGSGPAILQALEMVPWYNLITDAAVKRNFLSAINSRQKTIDLIQTEAVRQVDARLSPCTSGAFGLASIKPNASWKKSGITVAGGNGRGSSSYQLDFPHGLFVDEDETLYIADYSNNRIVEWKMGAGSGRVVAGGNGQGSAANQFNIAHDVIVDKARKSLLICDEGNRRIVRWPLQGGKSGEKIINAGPHVYITMDEEGSLYIGDVREDRIRKWRFGETQPTVVAGGNGVGSQLNQINGPRKIVVDRNRSVYVSDFYSHRVTKWMEGAREGIIVAGGNGAGNALSQLNGPEGILVDESETVYVADRLNHRIMRWPKGSREGQVIIGGMGAGSHPYQLNQSIGLAFDRYGNLLVTDSMNDRVQKFEIN